MDENIDKTLRRIEATIDDYWGYNVCIFMRWLCGSWKSTLAWIIQERFWFGVFNRDTMRLKYPNMKEKEIEQMELDYIKDTQKNIIIDNTHISKSLEKKIRHAQECSYITMVIDMRIMFSLLNNEQYLDICLERNKNREKEKIVPDSIIYEQFLFDNVLDEKVIICDIDWTVANIEHRLHYLEWEKDHKWFYSELSKDKPIKEVIELVNKLSRDYRIVFTSWRPNTYFNETKQRLTDNYLWFEDAMLLMRNSWDRRPDYQVKQDIYNRALCKQNIFLAIDDRKQVKEMWVKNWVFVLDVNQTDKVF